MCVYTICLTELTATEAQRYHPYLKRGKGKRWRWLVARRTKTPWKATMVVFALLAGLMLSVYPERAIACSCAGPLNHESTVLGHQVIFMGRLVDTRTYTQDTYLGDDSPLVGFKFEVEAVWKGSVPQVAYLSAIVGDGDACADLPYSTDLIVGVRYLVYTYESMELHLCSLVFREYEDGHSDQYLIEIMGTFEEQVANLGPAKAFSGAGTDQWPTTATPYALAPTPEPPTPTPEPPTPTSPPVVPTPAPSAGGCGRGNSLDLAVIGMLAGLAWYAVRRRNI